MARVVHIDSAFLDDLLDDLLMSIVLISILRHEREYIVLVDVDCAWYNICVVDIWVSSVKYQLLSLILTHFCVPIWCWINKLFAPLTSALKIGLGVSSLNEKFFFSHLLALCLISFLSIRPELVEYTFILLIIGTTLVPAEALSDVSINRLVTGAKLFSKSGQITWKLFSASLD